MIYDDKNIYYNYTMKYICKVRQIVKKNNVFTS